MKEYNIYLRERQITIDLLIQELKQRMSLDVYNRMTLDSKRLLYYINMLAVPLPHGIYLDQQLITLVKEVFEKELKNNLVLTSKVYETITQDVALDKLWLTLESKLTEVYFGDCRECSNQIVLGTGMQYDLECDLAFRVRSYLALHSDIDNDLVQIEKYLDARNRTSLRHIIVEEKEVHEHIANTFCLSSTSMAIHGMRYRKLVELDGLPLTDMDDLMLEELDFVEMV